MPKVVWLGKPETQSSWQPESSLPANIVEEYEKGVHQEISVKSFVSGGQSISMLSHTSDTTKRLQGKLRSDETKRQCLDKCHVESTNSG